MLNGIDVSNHQGNFDWAAWKGKIDFACIKVSGLGYRDPYAKQNFEGARSIGAYPVGYHFLYAGHSGAEQASWFLECAHDARMQPGEAFAVDVEQYGLAGHTDAQLWNAAEEFNATVHGHAAGWPWPIVYTDMSLAKVAPQAVGAAPLWLANPDRVPVTKIGPWNLITMEQTGQKGIDTDVAYFSSAADMHKLGTPTAPPAPPKPTAAEAKAALDVLGRYLA